MSPPGAAPGPRGLPVLGSLLEVGRDPLRFFTALAAEHLPPTGGVAGFRLGRQPAFLLASPEAVHQVLVGNRDNYPKQSRGYRAFREALGRGLVTSEGELWRRQRRLVQPAFHPRRVAALVPRMVAPAACLAARFEAAADRGEELDVSAAMGALTLEIAADTLLGTRVAAEAAAIGRSLEVVLAWVQDKAYGLGWIPWSWPTPANRAFRAALAALHGIVDDLMARRPPGEAGDDVLALLRAARDEETGAPMEASQLRDEVLTLLLAGHDTTANALGWTWHLLAEHPAVRERLDQELDTVLGGGPVTPEALPALVYTRAVLEESMRLYPPAWMVSRLALSDDQVEGVAIPAGSVIFVSPWVTHRLPGLWPDPERFDPERFLGERAAERPRFAYLPFGGGPRSCVGAGFALAEMPAVVATLAARVVLEPSRPGPVRPSPAVTLGVAGGLWMRPRRRLSRPSSPTR